jgi:hypothetical protein
MVGGTNVPSQDSQRRALVETSLKILAKDEVQLTALDFVPLFHAGRAVRGVKGRDNAPLSGVALDPAPGSNRRRVP